MAHGGLLSSRDASLSSESWAMSGSVLPPELASRRSLWSAASWISWVAMRLGNDYPQITPITQIQSQYNLDVGEAAALHAEGVTDSSRWSADHRITNQQIRHAEGVQDVWHAFSVQMIINVIRHHGIAGL